MSKAISFGRKLSQDDEEVWFVTLNEVKSLALNFSHFGMNEEPCF